MPYHATNEEHTHEPPKPMGSMDDEELERLRAERRARLERDTEAARNRASVLDVPKADEFAVKYHVLLRAWNALSAVIATEKRVPARDAKRYAHTLKFRRRSAERTFWDAFDGLDPHAPSALAPGNPGLPEPEVALQELAEALVMYHPASADEHGAAERRDEFWNRYAAMRASRRRFLDQTIEGDPR